MSASHRLTPFAPGWTRSCSTSHRTQDWICTVSCLRPREHCHRTAVRRATAATCRHGTAILPLTRHTWYRQAFLYWYEERMCINTYRLLSLITTHARQEHASLRPCLTHPHETPRTNPSAKHHHLATPWAPTCWPYNCPAYTTLFPQPTERNGVAPAPPLPSYGQSSLCQHSQRPTATACALLGRQLSVSHADQESLLYLVPLPIPLPLTLALMLLRQFLSTIIPISLCPQLTLP